MMDILYGLGAIASVVGAIFSWRYAHKARSFADRAGTQIASQRRISELSQLQLRWSETYKALAVFGPAATASELRGKNPSGPARSAQDFIEAIKRCRASLQYIPDLDRRLDELQPLLEAFSAARGSQDLKARGTDLLGGLSDLNAAIGSVLVSDRENIDLT